MASVEYDVAFAVAVDEVSSGKDVENTGKTSAAEAGSKEWLIAALKGYATQKP